jgi:hypothetical protein
VQRWSASEALGALPEVWCSGESSDAFCSLKPILNHGHRSQDAPNYKPGLYACLACAILNIILVGILSVNFRRLNGQADRGERELEDSDVSVTEVRCRSYMQETDVIAGGLSTGFPLHVLRCYGGTVGLVISYSCLALGSSEIVPDNDFRLTKQSAAPC